MALSIHPFGVKGCSKMRFLNNVPFYWFFLAMYPSDQNFLKASILGGPPAGFAGVWALQARRCADNARFYFSPTPAMDFTNLGGGEEKRSSYCAHVQRSDKGKNNKIRGPCRYRRPSVAGALSHVPSRGLCSSSIVLVPS